MWQVRSIVAIDGTHEASVPTPQCAASAAAVERAASASRNRRWLLDVLWKAHVPEALSAIVPLPVVPRQSPLVIPTPCNRCGRRIEEPLNDPTPRRARRFSDVDSAGGAGGAGAGAGACAPSRIGPVLRRRRCGGGWLHASFRTSPPARRPFRRRMMRFRREASRMMRFRREASRGG